MRYIIVYIRRTPDLPSLRGDGACFPAFARVLPRIGGISLKQHMNIITTIHNL